EAPRFYYTPPEKPEKNKKEKKAKKHGGGFVKMMCACLACALLGGVGGGAIVAGFAPKQTENESPLSLAPSNSENKPVAENVVTGSKLTGEQIYSLGCEQAVGVTTEITYTNFLGMQTTSPISGSGFIVTSDGYILTNYHVVKNAHLGGYKVSVVMFDGTSYDAKIVGVEEASDIAVLKIDATGLSAATLGDSGNMKVGQTVYALGNPLGELNFTLTSGMVSALDREITTRDESTQLITTNNMFQIDAAVNSGNSGGPVYNDKGEVIGIVTAKFSSAGVEGLGFAIPINDVVTMVDQLIENGYVSGKASFGIVVSTPDDVVVQYYNMVKGAYVAEVVAGSCSEKAGIKVGDTITEMNGKEIKSSSELTNEKRSYHAGDTVTLTIYRQGEYIKVDVTLDEEVPKSAAEVESKVLPAMPKA
ncbi:MAG: trypsin-like peptidase domain-containing protein, partial [Oscillospiraceae bacterium]